MTPGQPDDLAPVDVVVVGAGLIGATIAWRAARRGLSVALVDDLPGSGASFAAAGMLGATAEAAYGETALLRLCMAAAQRYPGFLADLRRESAVPVAHNANGTLVIGLDPRDQQEIGMLRSTHAELGLPSYPLSARECREREPLLSPQVCAGLAIDADQAVDPRALFRAVRTAGEQAGVRAVPQRVTGLLTAAGDAVGVRVGSGDRLPAGAVVLAAGAWSGSAAQRLGLSAELLPPVRPVKGQVLRLRGEPGGAPTRVLRGWVRGSSVYVVPYGDGRVVIGASSEEVGFDTSVSAGGAYELLRDAIALIPALGQLTLVEVSAGLRPGTPDNAPLIGPSEVPGLVLATGHYRNGVLLAPLTADAVVAHLTGAAVPDWWDAFQPLRFSRVTKTNEVLA